MKYRLPLSLRAVPILVGIACAGLPDKAQACNVPVFRYAMERWPADTYELVVYHRTGLRGPAFEVLGKALKDQEGAANLSLRGVDAGEPEGKAVAEGRGIDTYPWFEIYYPATVPIRTSILSGPLTVDRAKKILISPGRSRLAQQLLSGDVAVWVLLTSGHDEKDRRARESLKTYLDRASSTLRIPGTGLDTNGNPIEIADFQSYPVRFSLLEIARTDPDEALLVSALLRSEPDLGQYDEPVAFPVFGRGRALYALVGDGIQGKNILEACQSMLGWCSCEIKTQNPGTDLLISADWTRPFGGRMVKDPELPLTGLSGFLPDRKRPEAAARPSTPATKEVPALCKLTPPARGAGTARAGSSAQAPRPVGSPLLHNVLYLAGAAGMVLLSVSVFLTVRAKRVTVQRSVQR